MDFFLFYFKDIAHTYIRQNGFFFLLGFIFFQILCKAFLYNYLT